MQRREGEMPTDVPKIRIAFSEGLKDANGAIKAAVDILGVAASMTQNVPYIGIVSGALAEFLKIQNEVDAYKRDWKAVMAIAQKIKIVIDNVLRECESSATGSEALPKTLVEPFNELETCLEQTLETLNACRARPADSLARRFGVRAREYLNRGDLSDSIKQCRENMQTALDLFSTRLQIDQTFTMRAMAAILSELRDKQTTTQQSPRANAPVIGSLPSAPPIFYGRAHEIDHIVDLILNRPPARVAILGSGGIGKTSIALTVLHEPRVEECFGDRRYFISCEATSTLEGLLQELLTHFNLLVDSKAGLFRQDILLSHLRSLEECILCLDNLETPWDADTQSVEAFLGKLAGIQRLTLLVTTRGADRPSHIAWTRPHLTPITPLTLDAAVETWDAICDSHDDYSLMLIHAVDCVPLAVTLLARLAQSETSEVLWTRWEHERIELLQSRGPSSRLNQVDISINISLYGPRMQSESLAISALSVICTLPQGMLESRMSGFATVFKGVLPSLRRLITHLKQCSLVYSSEDGFLRVLSPIRLYMQAHHPVADPFLDCLYEIYHNLVDFRSDSFAIEAEYARNNIQFEIGNISTVLRLRLTRGSMATEELLEDIRSFSKLCRDLSINDTTLLSEAITRAGDQMPTAVGRLLQSKAECLYFQGHKNQSVAVLEKARDLHRSAGNRQDEADCLHRLGDVYLFNDRRDEALEALQASLDLWSGIEDQRGKARTLRSLGRLYNAMGRIEEGEPALWSALDIFTDTGDDLGRASTLETLSDLYIALRKDDKAYDVLQSALTLYQKIDYRHGEANILQNIGLAHVNVQQWAEGESALQAALDLYRELGGRMGEVHTLTALGSLYNQQQRYQDALAVLRPACEIASNISYTTGEGIAWSYLGRAHRLGGHWSDAERCLLEALRLFEKAGTPYNLEIARRDLVDLRTHRTDREAP